MVKRLKFQPGEYLENFTPIPVLVKTNLNGAYDLTLEWQEEEKKTVHTELKKYVLKIENSNQKLPVEIMEIYRKRQSTVAYPVFFL